MDELPHRTVINLQSAPRELGDQPAQGKVPLDSFQRPDTVFTGNRLRPVAANLTGCNAAGLSMPAHPSNCRADGNLELPGCPIARQTAGLNRGNNPLSKIQRVWLAHPCWPPTQPAW